MALLIFPTAVALGWLIRSPRRAAGVTVAVGVAALAGYLVLGFRGVEVSPLETVVLLLGTPLGGVIAHRTSRWRQLRTAGG